MILNFKTYRDLEIGVRGHSRSLKVAPFDNFKTYRDLEIGVRGHSRSLKVAPFDRSFVFPISVL